MEALFWATRLLGAQLLYGSKARKLAARHDIYVSFWQNPRRTNKEDWRPEKDKNLHVYRQICVTNDGLNLIDVARSVSTHCRNLQTNLPAELYEAILHWYCITTNFRTWKISYKAKYRPFVQYLLSYNYFCMKDCVQRTCIRMAVVHSSGPVYIKRFRPFSGQNVFRLMRLRLSFTLKHRKRIRKRPKTKTASKVFSQAFSAITFCCKGALTLRQAHCVLATTISRPRVIMLTLRSTPREVVEYFTLQLWRTKNLFKITKYRPDFCVRLLYASMDRSLRRRSCHWSTTSRLSGISWLSNFCSCVRVHTVLR